MSLALAWLALQGAQSLELGDGKDPPCWRGARVRGLNSQESGLGSSQALFSVWLEAGLAVLSGSTSAGHRFCLSGKPLALTTGPVQTLIPLPWHHSQKLPSSHCLDGVLPWETLLGSGGRHSLLRSTACYREQG